MQSCGVESEVVFFFFAVFQLLAQLVFVIELHFYLFAVFYQLCIETG